MMEEKKTKTLNMCVPDGGTFTEQQHEKGVTLLPLLCADERCDTQK